MKIAYADPPHIGRTLRRGLTGAKPEAVCHWCFERIAARPEDTLDDLFPGTGAVAAAWRTWQRKFTLPGDPLPDFPQPDSARRGRSLPRSPS